MVKLTKHDLIFILKQIKIAEAHAAGGDLKTLVEDAAKAAGATGTANLQAHLLPYGLRTVDGSYNNLFEGREMWGASGQPFVHLAPTNWVTENDDTIAFGGSTVLGPDGDYSQQGASTSGTLSGGSLIDADPRIISNLIVDQTSNNPAAIMVYQQMLADGKTASREQMVDTDGNLVFHTKQVVSPTGQVLANIGDPVYIYTFENFAPDIGDSAPYNSMFTLFGQFFDHGLDLVAKGGNGTVYIPLQEDDPLYVPGSPTNFMTMTRSTIDANGQVAANVTTPWVDQNQTYTSHPSHQVFLREYMFNDNGRPIATGDLLSGVRGLSTWGDVKAQARDMLGIELTDLDVGMVPMLLTDPYGAFVRGPNGLPYVLAGFKADGSPIYVEGDLNDPLNPSAIELTAGMTIWNGQGNPSVNTSILQVGDQIRVGSSINTLDAGETIVVNAARAPNAFLDDIAHAAAPVAVGGVLQQDSDDTVGYNGGYNARGQQTQYDNELLDAHYITGDGRGNENIGLSAIHHVFHSEHNHVVADTKQVILESGDIAFINEWLLKPIASLADIDTQAEIDALVWNGERLFQTGRFTTEMQYQHLVFEEFARKMQPDIDAFLFEPSSDVDPSIFAEFAHAVYRFGHSMLNQSIDRVYENEDGTFSFDNITLFDGFLNPLEFGAVDANGNVVMNHDEAAGAIIRGMSRQGGNEIDEFVTDVLRNQLVGIPLDLAALNIARGRDVGLPTLNQARAQFYEMAGQDTQLKPYTSWVDFALNMENPASIVNFIAAYGRHDTIESQTTLDGKRAAAAAIVLGGAGAPADRLDFLNATGTWANRETGFNEIDLWIGGLAEKKMDFGGMLGSTFSFVFELQLENLQFADRFYYLSRVQGLNLLNELENNSLSKIIMRNTDFGENSTALPGDIFSTPDHTLEMDISKQLEADPEHDNPILNALSPLVVRRDTNNDGQTDYLAYHGGAHVVIGGTAGNDTIIAGEGDDSIWGYGGDDTLEAGYGVDHVHGGEGDDIITNAGTDIGAMDFLHGEGGNDVINGGSGMALIFGNEGNDFIIGGPDGKHLVGGLDTDFVRGGDGLDFVMGNEGDDWLEGGAHFDTLVGENSELFFNSSIIGHDVMNGGSSDTDYDAESGDDIMFAGEGIQRFNGMAGFDWIINKDNPHAADTDLGIPIFATQEAFILRDRSDLVEGASGWIYDDVLTGRRNPIGARAELDNTAAIPAADSTYESFSNNLLEKNVDLIDGLREVVAHRVRVPALDANGNPYLDENGNPHMIVVDTSLGGDILLGGGGNDVIMGLGGDDIIDGDKWLNVRIRINDANGNEIGSADGMTTQVFSPTGQLLFGGRTLDALMFDRTLNPGQLEIVREILDGDPNNTSIDTAVYTDIVERYAFTWNFDGTFTVSHVDFDRANFPVGPEGAPNPVSDGTDHLRNIEMLRFSDGNGGTIDYTIREIFNSDPFGLPTISDTTPIEGQTISVSMASVTDGNGFGSFAYQWQSSVDGVTWVDINGATFASLSLANPGGQALSALAGHQLRVVVDYIDGYGFDEQVTSLATAPLGIMWSAAQASTGQTFVGMAGDDSITGTAFADNLSGAAGNDIINGGNGSDIINGGNGNDTLRGDAGNDVITGGAGDDVVDGGTGTGDVFVLNGPITNYKFSLFNSNPEITDMTGVEGTDRISNIEIIRIGGIDYQVVLGSTGSDANLNGGNGNQIIFARGGHDVVNGGGGSDILIGGAGNDTVNGGGGNDFIYQNAVTDVRDIIDGGNGVDTYILSGTEEAETFRIYTRAAAIAAGINANSLNANTEIVITRNGTNLASVVAQLDNIEEIIINTTNTTANNGGGIDTFSPEGDTILVFGNFNQTSLDYSTITINGANANDTVDITGLESEHRIVFTSNGGTDTVLGQVRPQDVLIGENFVDQRVGEVAAAVAAATAAVEEISTGFGAGDGLDALAGVTRQALLDLGLAAAPAVDGSLSHIPVRVELGMIGDNVFDLNSFSLEAALGGAPLGGLDGDLGLTMVNTGADILPLDLVQTFAPVAVEQWSMEPTTDRRAMVPSHYDLLAY